MHHWSKCRIDLNRDISSLESNWIRYFIAIDMDTNKCRVYQLNLNIFVSCF